MADGVADEREVNMVRVFFKKTFGDSNSARLFKASTSVRRTLMPFLTRQVKELQS